MTFQQFVSFIDTLDTTQRGTLRTMLSTETEISGLTELSSTIKITKSLVNSDEATILRLTAIPKVYRALITQSSTSAPTVTILENSLGGTVTWARSNTGQYTGTLTGVFLENKVFCQSELADPAGGHMGLSRLSDNAVVLQTSGTNSVLADSIANTASIEILVYP